MTRVLDREADSSLLTAKVLRPPRLQEEGRALLSDQGRFFPLRLSGGIINIQVLGQDPDWLYPVLQSMQHLDRLESNWDSYGAPKVSPLAIVQALNTLGRILQDESPAPTVVPTSAGNVQLEWHEGGIDLEIRCTAAGSVSAYIYDHESEGEEELARVGPEELARLAGVIRRIQV